MERVLLLNATYEPLALVSDRRAVVLMLAGRAEAVAVREDCSVFHSARLNIDVPSIVRLSHMVRIPRWARTPPVTRRSVLRRDGGLCVYCSQPADTIDHVIPRSRGGTHDWSNVVAACKRDNLVKADQLLSELGWTMSVKPAATGRAPLAVAAPVGCGPAVGAVSRRGLLRVGLSPVPLRRRAVPAPSQRGWRSPVRSHGRRWCSAAPSRRSWSTSPPYGSGMWRWRGGAAGEGPSISGRASSCGSTSGSAGRPAVGASTYLPPPSGSGRGGWRRWPALGSARLRGPPRPLGAGRPRRPRVLRRPGAGRGVPRRAQGGRACRSGERGRGPCSPRAPTCTGIRRRCWRWWTSKRTHGRAGPRPGAAGGRSGRPRTAGRSIWVSVRDRCSVRCLTSR